MLSADLAVDFTDLKENATDVCTILEAMKINKFVSIYAYLPVYIPHLYCLEEVSVKDCWS